MCQLPSDAPQIPLGPETDRNVLETMMREQQSGAVTPDLPPAVVVEMLEDWGSHSFRPRHKKRTFQDRLGGSQRGLPAGTEGSPPGDGVDTAAAGCRLCTSAYLKPGPSGAL